MENDDILRSTFFPDCLDFYDAKNEKRRYKSKTERNAFRDEQLEKSLDEMIGKDIVFVDPDNGLVVPSAKGQQ